MPEKKTAGRTSRSGESWATRNSRSAQAPKPWELVGVSMVDIVTTPEGEQMPERSAKEARRLRRLVSSQLPSGRQR